MTAWFLSLFAILFGLLLFAGAAVLISLTTRRDVLGAATARRLISFVAILVIADVFLVSRSDPRRLDAQPALSVIAIAHDTWWELRYPGFATANELHVPADETIAMRVVSDRRHLFMVGEGTVVRDSLFTRDTALLFRAHAGTWNGHDFSREHFALPLAIIAEPRTAFDRWSAWQRTGAAESPSNGRAVFQTARCTYCHTVRGIDVAEQRLGPDLTHLGSRATIAAGLLPNRDGYLAGWVVDAQELKPGCGMPRNAMQPQRLHALLAFLRQLR